jgi:hypothetical protein
VEEILTLELAFPLSPGKIIKNNLKVGTQKEPSSFSDGPFFP